MANINTNDERIRILRMVEEGKLNAQEAIGLLNALASVTKGSADETKNAVSPIEPITRQEINYFPGGNGSNDSKAKFRFFRVRVTDTTNDKPKVMVTIPFGLLEWGLKIGAQFSPEVSQFKIEDLNQLMESGINGKLVDVVDEEDGEHVEIFVE